MAGMNYVVDVLMDGQQSVQVQADQRDVAKWETQPFGCAFDQVRGKPLAFIRFIAWNAMRRQGKTKLPWEKFDDQCVYADLVAEEEDVDPTKPAASAES